MQRGVTAGIRGRWISFFVTGINPPSAMHTRLLLGGLLSVLFVSGGATEAVRGPGSNDSFSAPPDSTKPLRPLMVELAQDMDRIATGLWHKDYDLIEEGARSIAHHPKIDPAQLAKIKKALGKEIQGFVSMDKSVHSTSTELVQAAQAQDWSAVLDAHERLTRGCTSCHATYRERLRPVLRP
jgi:hypothetical protein